MLHASAKRGDEPHAKLPFTGIYLYIGMFSLNMTACKLAAGDTDFIMQRVRRLFITGSKHRRRDCSVRAAGDTKIGMYTTAFEYRAQAEWDSSSCLF